MDAINQLVDLFDSKNEFVKAFVESTLFFPPDKVKERNDELKKLHENDQRFHIRYSPSFKDHWPVKNKREAIDYTKEETVSLKGLPDYKIRIDNDGNYKVRYVIKDKVGHKVSWGKNSTIKNYTISHVWGYAHHPLFFSSLWNIVLVPTFFNFILDKSDDVHPVVGEVKNTIKQKCIELYDPYKSFLSNFPIDGEFKKDFNLSSINDSKYDISFVESKGSSKEHIVITNSEEKRIKELLGRMGNKFFIEYFEPYANEKDLKSEFTFDDYTVNSYNTRLSTLRTIFKEDLEIKALKLISEKENSRLSPETLKKASELFMEYK